MTRIWRKMTRMMYRLEWRITRARMWCEDKLFKNGSPNE